MKTESDGTFTTKGWYQSRHLFCPLRPGILQLANGHLEFRAGPAGSPAVAPCDTDSNSGETLFNLTIAEVVQHLSYHWLILGFKLQLGRRRHIVSFAGPPRGDHASDAVALAAGLSRLVKWRLILADHEARVRE